ncbi:MAG: alanine racemase [candidate division Zixibacteria bacterium]|nr:alanine racemase [candidate division Zixibacteria bacterium]
MKHLTWIDIDRKTILANVRNLGRLAGTKVALAAAVKANGYGHGLAEMTAILMDSPVEYLALHSTLEAEAAREAGWDRKILLVGGIAPEDIDAVLRLDIEPTVFDIGFIESLGRLCRRSKTAARVHIKLETGTNRQGFNRKELDRAATVLKKYPELKVEGASTHFANIEDTTDHTYAMYQLDRFKALVEQLKAKGIVQYRRHTACSAALLLFKDTYFDLVRPGIALYGYWPSKETYVSYKLEGGRNSILKPALSWYSRITQIKTVEADSFVGYGCTYRTSTRSTIAIIPVGYCDGFDRRLSNLGYVLVKGKRAPIRGRICMNLTMIDITDIPGVKVYDTVTIIGTDGKEQITADTHAGWCQSINYEVLSRLSPLIPRQVV